MPATLHDDTPWRGRDERCSNAWSAHLEENWLGRWPDDNIVGRAEARTETSLRAGVSPPESKVPVSDSTSAPPLALTQLSDDERLFADSVYEFAHREVRPLVREMDEHAKIAPALLPKLFDLGVMGIEIPEEYGGAGATLFHSVLAVESLSRVDPALGVLVDVQNTLVVNSFVRWASADLKQRYLPRLAENSIGAFCLSEAGSGSDAFALTTRAVEDGDSYRLTGRKLWITNGNEADLFIVFATVNPEAGYKGITAFVRRARHARLHRRPQGRQARHPRQQHLRAALRRLRRAEGQRARRGRQARWPSGRRSLRRAVRRRAGCRACLLHVSQRHAALDPKAM